MRAPITSAAEGCPLSSGYGSDARNAAERSGANMALEFVQRLE